MSRKIPRAQLLLGTAVSAGAAALVRTPGSAAQFVYKYGHPQAREVPLHVRSVQMANAVKAETNGRMEIEVFPDSQLGGQTAMLSQLRLGSIQFLNIGDSSYTGVVPVFALDSVAFAFRNWAQPIDALAGPLGAYIRREFAAKGMFAFPKVWAFGFRQMTSSTKPIRSADDLVGFRMRVVPAPIIVDFYKAMGASPVPLDSNELYTALQTRVVDGQESAFQIIESLRVYEVQKYLGTTNHTWTGETLVANLEAWKALPADIQAIVSRNADKYATLANNDVLLANAALADKLKRQGLVFNGVDVTSMRARLGAYYAHWKNEMGSTAWSLLETTVGKLG